jgi:hypothetical protein
MGVLWAQLAGITEGCLRYACCPSAEAGAGLFLCVVSLVKVETSVQRVQYKGCQGNSPGWWEPCRLWGEPVVLVLAGAMVIWMVWFLRVVFRGIVILVASLAMFGWWRGHAKEKLLR